MTVNDAWHRAHPMPPNASTEQRVEWHVAHAEACGCREVPARLQAEVRRRSKRSG